MAKRKRIPHRPLLCPKCRSDRFYPGNVFLTECSLHGPWCERCDGKDCPQCEEERLKLAKAKIRMRSEEGKA